MDIFWNHTIDKDALQALPENGVLPEVTKIEYPESNTTEIGVDAGHINPDNNERV